MLDKKKIILNHLRSSRTNNKKVSLFFQNLYAEIFERLEIKKNKKYSILELLARNNFCDKVLTKKKINYTACKTIAGSELKYLGLNTVLHNSDFTNLKKSHFDICISLFPIVENLDLVKLFQSTFNILVNEGKFLFIFHSIDSCEKIKEVFGNFLSANFKNIFLPCFDIMTLGNHASSTGFKNVVVDKSKYIITSDKVSDLWKFRRDMGESNYFQGRNKKKITKRNYIKLVETLNKNISNGSRVLNEINITFLTGTKKS